MTTLQSIITQVNGSAFISITTKTTPKLKGGKANPFQNNVTKITEKANVMIFSNKNGSAYSNMVKRRMVAEGKDPETFTVSPRTWGTRIENTPFVEHKGELYIEVIYMNSGTTKFMYNGQEIDRDSITGLDSEDSQTSQGGIENKVIIRTIKVENVKEITINHQHYVL